MSKNRLLKNKHLKIRKKVNLYAKQRERFRENGNFAGNLEKYIIKNKRQKRKKDETPYLSFAFIFIQKKLATTYFRLHYLRRE